MVVDNKKRSQRSYTVVVQERVHQVIDISRIPLRLASLLPIDTRGDNR